MGGIFNGSLRGNRKYIATALGALALGVIGFFGSKLGAQIAGICVSPQAIAQTQKASIFRDSCMIDTNLREHDELRGDVKSLKDDNKVIMSWMYAQNEWAYRYATGDTYPGWRNNASTTPVRPR